MPALLSRSKSSQSSASGEKYPIILQALPLRGRFSNKLYTERRTDAIGGSRLSAVVRVLDRQDREQLDLLLSQAKETFGGRREIVALISSALLPLSAQELALLQRYGAQIYEVAPACPPDVN